LFVNFGVVWATIATWPGVPKRRRCLNKKVTTPQVFSGAWQRKKRQLGSSIKTLVRNGADALHVAGDTFFTSRRVQFATLAATNRIPATYPSREAVEVGGLMGYATDRVDMWRQVGAYTGQIMKGAKPADLPVLQSTKFEFIINLQTARALGIEVPPALLARADAVIE
jgi:putative tryptophan/tyrosine transport system substrate-binding protein